MANTGTSTIETPTATSPAAALWRIVVSNYEQAVAGCERHRPIFDEAEKAYFADREGQREVFTPIENDHNAWIDEVYEERNKLLLTPAPDAEAMLYKLELLSALMTESCEQDAPAVRAIRDDAKRLLGSK